MNQYILLYTTPVIFFERENLLWMSLIYRITRNEELRESKTIVQHYLLIDVESCHHGLYEVLL
jgi:hypothetical protein